jgi:hypothetical protein
MTSTSGRGSRRLLSRPRPSTLRRRPRRLLPQTLVRRDRPFAATTEFSAGPIEAIRTGDDGCRVSELTHEFFLAFMDPENPKFDLEKLLLKVAEEKA